MIYRIDIWERTSGEYMIAGELVCEIADSGRAHGAFRYSREYLARDNAFPLDPVSLHLKTDTFTIEHPGVFSVFEDSLPDDWGRKLLVRKHNIRLHEQNLPNLLLALGSSGLGALSYTGKAKPGDTSRDASILQLSDLLRAAEMYERGEIKGAGLSLLLGAGSSPGGARPKALVFNEENGVHYIAKFPSIKDQADIVRIEAATMSLAANAGLAVPETCLIQCGSRTALLVKRFDISASGRRHMISMQTLLKVQGYYQSRYMDVLSIIRKHSSNPKGDSEMFYRQMVLNAVVGNTDDHLKNFWMLYDADGGWRLSPAFDLLPDIGQRGEHVLFFDLGAVCPGRRKLENLGRSWGIGNASALLDQVYDAVKSWKDEFSNFGVTEKDLLSFKEIDSNLLL